MAQQSHPLKQTLIFFAKLMVTILVIVYIVKRFSWDEIAHTLTNAKIEWFITAILVFAFSGVLGAIQWRLLLKIQGIRLSNWRAISLYFMGMFFNNFIFGTAAADALRVTYIKLDSGQGKAGFAATFLDRFAGLLALLIFAVAGSILILHQGVVTDKTLGVAIAALFGVFILFTAFLTFLFSRRLQHLFFLIFYKMPLPKKKNLEDVIRQTLLEHKDLRFFALLTILALFIQFLRIGVHVICGIALGLVTGANVAFFFIFVPMIAMFMMIPMPFGVREALQGTLFALAGFEPGAVVIGFLATIASIISSSAGAVFFLMNRSELKKAQHAQDNSNESIL